MFYTQNVFNLVCCIFLLPHVLKSIFDVNATCVYDVLKNMVRSNMCVRPILHAYCSSIIGMVFHIDCCKLALSVFHMTH